MQGGKEVTLADAPVPRARCGRAKNRGCGRPLPQARKKSTFLGEGMQEDADGADRAAFRQDDILIHKISISASFLPAPAWPCSWGCV
jgi:hypothetical protein